MDLLFEIIFSIIFESSIEGMKAETVPLWIRAISTIIVSLTFIFVIGIIGIFSVFMWKENQLLSTLFLILELFLIISIIKKMRESKIKRWSNEK